MGCNWTCPIIWNGAWWLVGQTFNYLMSGATNAVYFVSASDLQQ
jgi:hypothetical protein